MSCQFFARVYTSLAFTLVMPHKLILCFAGDSQISEEEGQFGTFRGNHFVPLTNYTFKFMCKVVAPHALKDHTGFVVDVALGAGGAGTTG